MVIKLLKKLLNSFHEFSEAHLDFRERYNSDFDFMDSDHVALFV